MDLPPRAWPASRPRTRSQTREEERARRQQLGVQQGQDGVAVEDNATSLHQDGPHIQRDKAEQPLDRPHQPLVSTLQWRPSTSREVVGNLVGLPPRPHSIARSNPGHEPSEGVGGSVITGRPSSALGPSLSGGIASSVSLPSNTNTRPMVQGNSAKLGGNTTDRSRNAPLPPPGGVNYDPNSTICRESSRHVSSNASQQQWTVTRPGPNGLHSARVGPSQPRTEPEMANLRIGENRPNERNYAPDYSSDGSRFPHQSFSAPGYMGVQDHHPNFPEGNAGPSHGRHDGSSGGVSFLQPTLTSGHIVGRDAFGSVLSSQNLQSSGTEVGRSAFRPIVSPRPHNGPGAGAHNGAEYGQHPGRNAPYDSAISEPMPQTQTPARSVAYGDSLTQAPVALDRLHPSSTWNKQGEPRVSVPTFNGKVEWRVFWLQFDLVASRFGWSRNNTLDRLASSLRDDALDFYAELPPEVRRDLDSLVEAFSRRFDDRKLPETYRASLPSIKKGSKESMAEFASRIRKNVNKAYPGIYGTRLLEQMTIEHLLNGLPDHSLVYDVKTKKPHSVEAALDLIQWHESCKGTQGRMAGLRQVSTHEDEHSEAVVRRTGGKTFITEERLNQFGRELATSISAEVKKNSRWSGPRKEREQDWHKTAQCFNCKEIGHIKRNCPSEQKRQAPRADGANAESEDPLNL